MAFLSQSLGIPVLYHVSSAHFNERFYQILTPAVTRSFVLLL
jgi:hypothetical protein